MAEEEIIAVASALQAAEDRMEVDEQTWFDTPERDRLMRKRGKPVEEDEPAIPERDPSFVLGTEDIRMLVADAVAGHSATELVLRNVSRGWRRALRMQRGRRNWNGFAALCADAAGRGELSVLQWLRKQGCPWDGATCASAEEGGHLAVLQWAWSNGCDVSVTTGALAAKGGHVEVLEWLRKTRLRMDEHLVPYSAARYGQLEVLKWCRNNDIGVVDLGVVDRAARAGHLDVVKWAVEECGVQLNESTCAAAVHGGHLEVAKWVHAHGARWSQDAVNEAAQTDRLEILKWAEREVVEFNEASDLTDPHTVSFAAGTGNLDLVKYLAARGYPLTSYGICSRAARSGSLEILQWARDNGCPWDFTTCSAAAGGGHLQILQWCRAQGGCPWNDQTCTSAAAAGHLETLQWAHEHGCPWHETACNAAAREGHLDVLKWLHANGCPWSERATTEAARGDQLEVLQWLRSEGCPWDINVLIWGQGEARRWAVANFTRKSAEDTSDDDDEEN